MQMKRYVDLEDIYIYIYICMHTCTYKSMHVHVIQVPLLNTLMFLIPLCVDLLLISQPSTNGPKSATHPPFFF